MLTSLIAFGNTPNFTSVLCMHLPGDEMRVLRGPMLLSHCKPSIRAAQTVIPDREAR